MHLLPRISNPRDIHWSFLIKLTLVCEASPHTSLTPSNVLSTGQLMLTSDIENFPGYPKGIEGPHMMKDLKEQVMLDLPPLFAPSLSRLIKATTVWD